VPQPHVDEHEGAPPDRSPLSSIICIGVTRLMDIVLILRDTFLIGSSLAVLVGLVFWYGWLLKNFGSF
jgi:hypothetical protein